MGSIRTWAPIKFDHLADDQHSVVEGRKMKKSSREMMIKKKVADTGKECEEMSFWAKLKLGYNPMEEGVRWTEKYADNFERFWKKTPVFLQKVIVVVAIALLGSSLKGEWILIGFSLYQTLVSDNSNSSVTGQQLNHSSALHTRLENATAGDLLDEFLGNITAEKMHLSGWWWHMFGTVVVSYAMYFGIGGLVHWYFYVRQRDTPKEWKCQPDKFMSPDLERHEILFGSFSLMFSCAVTATVSCYAFNRGPLLTFYYEWLEYGWWWLFLQIPVIFLYQDYTTYWIHRIYHTPFLYKHFHKMHHKYKQPTVFSVTAIHPFEIVNIQLLLMLPIVVIPLHPMMFYLVAVYTYYHGIIDHSGVNFKAFWWQPWQPDAIFHDNHHQYFHVNFAFNIFIWDKLHNTYRRKDRVYNENIYFGKGKALNEVPEDVLKVDLEERESENPLAYRSDTNENQISQEELKKLTKKSK